MPTEPQWLSAKTEGRVIGVDREAKVIRGYVVAQEGPFKSAGRGEFDTASLKQIVKLMKAKGPAGLKSRFTHPTMSDDGLGKLLGFAKNPSLDMVEVERGGETVQLQAVRADLHLSPAAFSSPSGDLGTYVMDLAELHPQAVSSSLVLNVDQEYRIEKNGTPKVDDQGNALPPLWRPTALHATDVVDTGDAVDNILSPAGLGVDVDGLPLSALWKGCEMLDRVFAGQRREVIEARCRAWLDRYLAIRFGETPALQAADVERMMRRLRAAEMGTR